jgi:sugar transferase EpsL
MRLIIKRCFDIAFASLAFLVLLPLLALVAIAVRFAMGTPVFFTQTRPGYKGSPFRLLKFRTMTEARDAQGHMLPDSERLTKLGVILRRYSLDELPQIWNILGGSMSFVGPRPLLMEYLPRYTPEQMRRHDAKPGVTGWAQINGRNTLTWEQRFQLDVWYVEHQCLRLDTFILARTFSKVVRREGISQVGHATMSKFMGTNRLIQ